MVSVFSQPNNYVPLSAIRTTGVPFSVTDPDNSVMRVREHQRHYSSDVSPRSTRLHRPLSTAQERAASVGDGVDVQGIDWAERAGLLQSGFGEELQQY